MQYNETLKLLTMIFLFEVGEKRLKDICKEWKINHNISLQQNIC